MLVGLDEAPGVLPRALIERILVQHNLELTKVDRDRILANDYARVIFDIFDLAEPTVCADVSCCEPLGRVRVENTLHEIATLIADKLRDRVVSVQDFLVEYVGLRVFEGQITADHGVKNHTT